jgi:hypothetical protein
MVNLVGKTMEQKDIKVLMAGIDSNGDQHQLSATLDLTKTVTGKQGCNLYSFTTYLSHVQILYDGQEFPLIPSAPTYGTGKLVGNVLYAQGNPVITTAGMQGVELSGQVELKFSKDGKCACGTLTLQGTIPDVFSPQPDPLLKTYVNGVANLKMTVSN